MTGPDCETGCHVPNDAEHIPLVHDLPGEHSGGGEGGVETVRSMESSGFSLPRFGRVPGRSKGIRTIPYSYKPRSVKVFGAGVAPGGLVDGFAKTFVCDSRYVGEGELSVGVRGPGGDLEVRTEMDDGERNKVTCSYDTREPGEYRIAVLWDGKPVPKSPFSVKMFKSVEELEEDQSSNPEAYVLEGNQRFKKKQKKGDPNDGEIIAIADSLAATTLVDQEDFLLLASRASRVVSMAQENFVLKLRLENMVHELSNKTAHEVIAGADSKLERKVKQANIRRAEKRRDKELGVTKLRADYKKLQSKHGEVLTRNRELEDKVAVLEKELYDKHKVIEKNEERAKSRLDQILDLEEKNLSLKREVNKLSTLHGRARDQKCMLRHLETSKLLAFEEYLGQVSESKKRRLDERETEDGKAAILDEVKQEVPEESHVEGINDILVDDASITREADLYILELDGIFKCRSCDKEWAKGSKKCHVRDHTEAHVPNIRVRCTICDQVLHSRPLLRKHKAVKHSKTRRKCDICGYTDLPAKDYDRHMKKHQGSKDKSCQ